MRHGHEAHVVVVERVGGDTVGKRGQLRAGADGGPEHAARSPAPSSAAIACAICAAGSRAPASITPIVSANARAARSRASGPIGAVATKSAIIAVLSATPRSCSPAPGGHHTMAFSRILERYDR